MLEKVHLHNKALNTMNRKMISFQGKEDSQGKVLVDIQFKNSL
jgi:hypothetical protein